jgi:hypothetical protein
MGGGFLRAFSLRKARVQPGGVGRVNVLETMRIGILPRLLADGAHCSRGGGMPIEGKNSDCKVGERDAGTLWPLLLR